jgi:hypothetical protein
VLEKPTSRRYTFKREFKSAARPSDAAIDEHERDNKTTLETKHGQDAIAAIWAGNTLIQAYRHHFGFLDAASHSSAGSTTDNRGDETNSLPTPSTDSNTPSRLKQTGNTHIRQLPTTSVPAVSE